MQKYKMLFDCTVCIKNTDYEISLSRAIVFTLACLLQKICCHFRFRTLLNTTHNSTRHRNEPGLEMFIRNNIMLCPQAKNAHN